MAEERGSEPAALLTYRAVAERLGVPVGTIHYWVSRHEIPHVRLGPRSVRSRPGEIERWLDERAVARRVRHRSTNGMTTSP